MSVMSKFGLNLCSQILDVLIGVLNGPTCVQHENFLLPVFAKIEIIVSKPVPSSCPFWVSRHRLSCAERLFVVVAPEVHEAEVCVQIV